MPLTDHVESNIFMTEASRAVEWETGTREVLRGFPAEIRWAFGRALYKVELGKRPRNASPLKGRLRGVTELSATDRSDTYRLYYTLKCPGYVHVLYCHKKKSKRGIGIPKHEQDLILQRFKDAMIDCRERKKES